MSDDERDHEDSRRFREDGEEMSEAKMRMELEIKKRKERDEEELKEYQEQRRIEKEKEDEEIRLLKEKKERRKLERVEEDRRLNELRVVEEQKRRAEEDERQRRKREEERKRQDERDKKRKEADDRSKKIGKRNFVINRNLRSCSVPPGSGGMNSDEEVVSKSHEQLDAERKAILEQRIPPLSVSGLDKNGLVAKAKELHQSIYRLESDRYDLEDRFKRQQYDMMDLRDRARQMNKGSKSKTNRNDPDPLAEKMSGIPPKISMYNEYERVKDHRTFVERRHLYAGPQYADEYERIKPEKQVVMTEEGAREMGDYVENDENQTNHVETASSETTEPTENLKTEHVENGDSTEPYEISAD